MRGQLLSGVHQAIGNTPMVHLSRLTAGFEGTIYAKLEYLNPGFSKKDRIALQIIEEAERDGSLQPGQTVVELTSGNTGTGLAIVCAVKGYPFIAVMSRGNSYERARMMMALGAEVVLVDQAPDSAPGQVSGESLALVEAEARRIVREKDAFRADQFERLGNTHAHEYHTAAEMWEQTKGEIDVFVDFAGSGGTFAGCAKALKRYKPSIRCYLVEPDQAPYLAERAMLNPNHRIQGGGYSMDLPLLNRELVTDYLTVTDEDAIAAARELAKKEGIFAGFSSGANIAAALQLLQERERGARIALTINDSGLKYLSTDLFE
ncbi:PLP-dependent cysteine synthase family protein [Paenibacillus sp. CF384]|uniref:PLP-dependent cysteine synthase family protein n=1 Tax=Paenibacillus sp. CF384 TaxID=1884382 RepID=UPI000895E885|nr:cysteine synthase family protein [Paenibacillus sp. CF384]SDW16674.1 cysteine synthase A [Paenibacillus sp. CF384]